MIVGGLGTVEFAAGGPPNLKGSILMVGDVLYVTAPDNVWAPDAHDSHVLWQHDISKSTGVAYRCVLFESKVRTIKKARSGMAIA